MCYDVFLIKGLSLCAVGRGGTTFGFRHNSVLLFSMAGRTAKAK